MAQLTAGRQAIQAPAGAARPATGVPTLDASVRWLGFWSATATVTTYIVFLVSGVGTLTGVLSAPLNAYIPFGASILIAPSFVLLMISIHYSAPEAKKIWSHAAIAFAILYAAFVSIVYVTWLFVVEPHILNRTESQVALLGSPTGSFMELVDGLGYTYMGLAACITAPIFA